MEGVILTKPIADVSEMNIELLARQPEAIAWEQFARFDRKGDATLRAIFCVREKGCFLGYQFSADGGNFTRSHAGFDKSSKTAEIADSGSEIPF